MLEKIKAFFGNVKAIVIGAASIIGTAFIGLLLFKKGNNVKQQIKEKQKEIKETEKEIKVDEKKVETAKEEVKIAEKEIEKAKVVVETQLNLESKKARDEQAKEFFE